VIFTTKDTKDTKKITLGFVSSVSCVVGQRSAQQ